MCVCFFGCHGPCLPLSMLYITYIILIKYFDFWKSALESSLSPVPGLIGTDTAPWSSSPLWGQRVASLHIQCLSSKRHPSDQVPTPGTPPGSSSSSQCEYSSHESLVVRPSVRWLVPLSLHKFCHTCTVRISDLTQIDSYRRSRLKLHMWLWTSSCHGWLVAAAQPVPLFPRLQWAHKGSVFNITIAVVTLW